MKRARRVCVVLMLLLSLTAFVALAAASPVAQDSGKPDSVAEKPPLPTSHPIESTAIAASSLITVTVAPSYPVPDDGNEASCFSLVAPPAGTGRVTGVEVEVAMTHSYVGDLVFQLRSPDAESLTLLNRPGFPGSTFGDASDLSGIYPIVFGDSYADDAEAMGDGIISTQVICLSDGRCAYAPNPDGDPSSVADFAAFAGTLAAGTWKFCVRDNSAGDTGTLDAVTLKLTVEPEPGPVYCAQPDLPVPGNNAGGVQDVLVVAAGGIIADLDVYLDARHTYVGDLTFQLEHLETGTMVTLVDRPGNPATVFGCSGDDIITFINDEGAGGNVETMCRPGATAISGDLVGGDPADTSLLAAFDGEELAGSWQLTVSDEIVGDSGTLGEWCLVPSIEPVITVQPASLSSTQLPGVVVTRTLEIANAGDNDLVWDLSEGAGSCGSDLPWLAPSPVAGTTPAGTTSMVTVTFDSDGVDPGSYSGDLCVNSNDPVTPQVLVPVALTVEPFELFLPMLTK